MPCDVQIDQVRKVHCLLIAVLMMTNSYMRARKFFRLFTVDSRAYNRGNCQLFRLNELRYGCT